MKPLSTPPAICLHSYAHVEAPSSQSVSGSHSEEASVNTSGNRQAHVNQKFSIDDFRTCRSVDLMSRAGKCANFCCPKLKVSASSGQSGGPNLRVPFLHSSVNRVMKSNESAAAIFDPQKSVTPLCASIIYGKSIDEISSLWRVNGLVDPRLLLEECVSQQQVFYGTTFLHFAMRHQRRDVFEKLIEDIFVNSPVGSCEQFRAITKTLIGQGVSPFSSIPRFEGSLSDLMNLLVVDSTDPEHLLYVWEFGKVFTLYIDLFVKEGYLAFAAREIIKSGINIALVHDFFIRIFPLFCRGTLFYLGDLKNEIKKHMIIIRHNEYMSSHSMQNTPESTDILRLEFENKRRQDQSVLSHLDDFLSALGNYHKKSCVRFNEIET